MAKVIDVAEIGRHGLGLRAVLEILANQRRRLAQGKQVEALAVMLAPKASAATARGWPSTSLNTGNSAVVLNPRLVGSQTRRSSGAPNSIAWLIN